MMMINTVIPPLPIFIKGGEATFRKGEAHFKRKFHIFDLIFVTKGTLYMKEEENNFVINEGEYIILAPHLEHVGNKKCVTETEYYWIHFSLSSPYKLVEEKDVDWSIIIKRENTFVHSDLYELFLPRRGGFHKIEHAKDLFLNLLQLNDLNDPAERMKQQTYFFEIVVQLQKEALELPSSAQTVSNRCIQYIKENYRSHTFTIKNMSKELLYHPDYLTRSMKRSIGMTPVQYINHYRLSRAKQSLQDGNLDLKSISRESGFADVSYFSRVFKKKEGMTPGQYRRLSSNRIHQKKD